MPRAKPIPFVAKPGQRGTGTTDARFVNVLFEIDSDPAPDAYPVQCLKRPGLANSTQPPAAAAVGRGVYAWSATGHIYSVFANKIWLDTTDMGVTLAASTGRVWFAERHVGSGTRMLIVSDGADNYNIETNDTITQIDASDDAQYPAANLGPIVELDGFIFQAQSNGKIWNTDANSATSWAATSFLTADTFGSDLEALARQKDQIIAFTKNRVEFFFNNGNPTGSPLLRIDQNTLGFGIAAKGSLAFSGETLCFVGENSADGDGGRAVYIIKSLGGVKDISTPYINRILAAEGTAISTCTAWMERVAGQLVYVLNLDSAERTFVYSVDAGRWSEWYNAAGDGKFPGISATSLNGTVYVQDAANGRIYTFPATTYQDSGVTFGVTLQTPRSNFGSNSRKTEPGLSIVGDTVAANVTVEVSDDDYANWKTVGTIDMSSQVKRCTKLGSFFSRAHRFTHSANTGFRVQAWMPEVNGGSL